MKISGFTFVRNATKLYIPVKESVESILPICDEFVIAVGKGEEQDQTMKEILAINSEKIKIIETEWDVEKYPRNTIYAQQTNIAKSYCTGDWLFYLQCDEVIHEDDLPKIKALCERELGNPKCEGFIFDYLHFWGDYNHYHKSHTWYPKEIRIIRNDTAIHSRGDAQSFRKFENWEGTLEDYLSRENSRVLYVKHTGAQVFHYGYVRPPKLMTAKRKSSHSSYHGKSKGEELTKDLPIEFDYGDINKLTLYKGNHPAVMGDWMAKLDWSEQLKYDRKKSNLRQPHKHERLKYRVISFFENLLGVRIGGIKNYKLID